jgi:hypothetical protein
MRIMTKDQEPIVDELKNSDLDKLVERGTILNYAYYEVTPYNPYGYGVNYQTVAITLADGTVLSVYSSSAAAEGSYLSFCGG